MLDEEEYVEALRLYGECMKGAKEFRQKEHNQFIRRGLSLQAEERIQ
jgi:hypothetical protein